MDRIIKFLEVEHPEGASGTDMFLINEDLLPVVPEHRTWKWWNYITFWLADSFNLNTFMIASSMVGAGLSWWQAWLCVIIGYSIAAFFLVLNAWPGAVHHLIFPAYIRASFGVYGALWPVFNRAGMACIWYGVQAWIGGECVYTLLCAMSPHYANIPNGIPNSGTTTSYFVAFFIFSFVSLFAIYQPIHKIKHLFTVKAVLAPAAGLGLFGWCIAKAGGVGAFIHEPATVSGGELGWAFVIQLMSCISNMATLITNAVDFASRSSAPSNVVVPQLVALPFTFSIVSLFGILIASSTQSIFGEFIWSPNDIMVALLKDGTAPHTTRAGVAFISIGFIVAQLGTNIAANSISAGCDLTSLAPRFINIRRGGFICALVGFAMCPWHLLSSSNNFTTYLSAYSVFLSSIAGVMVTNYYVVAKRRLHVDSLYTLHGHYGYFYGVNLRAYGAYFAGIAINIVGFVGVTGVQVPESATHIYDLSWFTGFGVSGLVFILLNKIWPVELPTDAECEVVTAGTPAWGTGGDSEIYRSSFDSKEKDDKEMEGAEGGRAKIVSV